MKKPILFATALKALENARTDGPDALLAAAAVRYRRRRLGVELTLNHRRQRHRRSVALVPAARHGERCQTVACTARGIAGNTVVRATVAT